MPKIRNAPWPPGGVGKDPYDASRGSGPLLEFMAVAEDMAPMTTTRSELPQGDDKVRAVQDMFDAIALRYDLVNRIMTFRMDVGWRRRAVGSLALLRGSTVLDLACGTGDLCRELASAGPHALGIDLSFGMLAAARTCPAGPGRRPAPARPGRFGRRGHVRLRPAQPGGAAPFLAELGRVLRPGGASPCSVRRPEPDPPLGAPGLLRDGGAGHRRPAVRWLRLSLPAPARSRTCRRRTTCAGWSPMPSSSTSTVACSPGHRPAHPRHEGCVTRSWPARRLDADVDLLRFAERDGCCSARRSGVAGRGCARASRGSAATRRRPRAPRLAGIDVEDDVRLPGCGPVAFGSLPFSPGAPSELVVPAVAAGRADDGTRWVTTITPPNLP